MTHYIAVNESTVELLLNARSHYTEWAKKSKRAYFCNNFVYCQPMFIIFGTYTLLEIGRGHDAIIELSEYQPYTSYVIFTRKRKRSYRQCVYLANQVHGR